jgi:hypothetical protein
LLKLQKDIDALVGNKDCDPNDKACVKGGDALSKLKSHYLNYGSDLKDRMVDIFGNLTNATASGDE